MSDVLNDNDSENTSNETPSSDINDTTDVNNPSETLSDIPNEDGGENPPVESVQTKKTLKDRINLFSNGIDKILNDTFEHNKYMDIFVRAFASYFILTLFNLTKIEDDFKTLDYPKNIDIKYFVLYLLIVFIALTLIKYIVKNLGTDLNTDGYFLGTSIILYGFTTVFRYNNVYYAFGVALVVSICMVFLLSNDYFKEFKTLSNLQTKIIVAIFGIFTTGFIATLCVYRYLIYASSCFDLGIFSQMYYHMANTLLPNTTCERNRLLSHFAVHVSPIYYVLLPIYKIFQGPKTLLICQAILVESGVIPLYLICKHFKFSNGTTMAMCMVHLFSPAYITACFFDFHENKFLVPLVMWLLWAVETGHIKLMYLFTVLTLFVKEDAFIYVVCIALFMLTSNKKYFDKKLEKERSLRWHGIFITAVGLFYFSVVNMLMDKYGLGIMQYHYNNVMMEPDKGIINVVVTALLDPALAISECFKEEKFIFFLEMTAPMLFLPFISKKISHVFLLVPFFLVNLISGNGYQNQLGYQYVCGVMSMLIYLSVLNLHELKCTPKRYFATASMCTSMVLGIMFGSDKLYYYDVYCRDGYRLNCINHMVSLIPEDASVEASTYFVPQLSQRKVVYMMDKPEDVEYENTNFVLMRTSEDFRDEKIEYLIDNGYEFYNGYEDEVYLFVQSSYLNENPELLENQRNAPIPKV